MALLDVGNGAKGGWIKEGVAPVVPNASTSTGYQVNAGIKSAAIDKRLQCQSHQIALLNSQLTGPSPMVRLCNALQGLLKQGLIPPCSPKTTWEEAMHQAWCSYFFVAPVAHQKRSRCRPLVPFLF